MTQGEIAKLLGVSQVQVSRLENKIIEKLREEFLKAEHEEQLSVKFKFNQKYGA